MSVQYVKFINVSNKKNKKIISFSLYNIDNTERNFFKGIFANYHMAKTVYPDWIIRIYLPYTEPENYIKIIESFKDIEIILVKTNICLRALRFLPYDDENVSLWVSRDLDSLVNWREKAAVDDWLRNYPDKELHIMHDSIYHRQWSILGGMFGMRNLHHNVKFEQLINQTEFKNDKYGLDCIIAEKLFLKKSNYIQHHSSGKKLENSVPFPKHEPILYNHVGAIIDMNKIYFDMKLETIYPVEINKKVPPRIFIFWTDRNSLTENTIKSIENIKKVSGVEVLLITPDNLSEWINKDFPLHPAYKYLSSVHKADYLRCYFMHIHGGGYCDIKKTSADWNRSFELLNLSNCFCNGYREIKGGVAVITDKKLYNEMNKNYEKLIGNGAYIFRPKTVFTTEWFTELHKILDKKLDLLIKNPPSQPRDHNGISNYPIGWTEILGNIFHPLCYKYSNYILQDLPTPIFLEVKN